MRDPRRKRDDERDEEPGGSEAPELPGEVSLPEPWVDYPRNPGELAR